MANIGDINEYHAVKTPYNATSTYAWSISPALGVINFGTTSSSVSITWTTAGTCTITCVVTSCGTPTTQTINEIII